MNSIIETVENKIKPKPQFINEKISKILNFKKKKKKEKKNTEFSKDRHQILLLIKEYRLHGTKHQKKAIIN